MMASLDTFIAQHQDVPFKWGQNDCCLFVANWILTATGKDLASDFRGKYTTRNGAFKSLFKAGLNNLQTLFKDRLNIQININYAKRGDIALVHYNDELVGGIIGLNCVYCISDKGVVCLPISQVDCAFELESHHE